MNLLRLLGVLFIISATVCAEESYELLLARPVKAGARFKVVARVAVQNETKTTVGRLPENVEKVEVACKLTGELTVTAVTAKGIAKELRLKLDEVESYEDGEKVDLFKTGDVIRLKKGGEKDDVTVNGEEADESAAELIDSLLSVADDEDATDDEVFGAKEKKKVGDEWDANREILARELARQKLDGLKPGDFKASTRLGETSTVAGEPAVRVVCQMKFASKNVRLENLEQGMKATRVSGDVRSEMDFPIALSSLSLRARSLMQFEFEATGKTRDEEGEEVPTSVKVKRRSAVEATETQLE